MTNRSRARIAVSAIFVITPLIGADQPKFETASVKVAERCSMRISMDPGRVALDGAPLSVAFMEAFKVKMDQIVGPSWLDSDCFSIIGKFPEGATREQLPEMLRTLLAERFKLVSHKESRQRSGYSLVVDKNGVKFRESSKESTDAKSGSGPTRTVAFGFRGTPAATLIKGAITMNRLASHLSGKLGAPVQDLTGLTGTYDIDFSWTPDPAFEAGTLAGAEPNTPTAETSAPSGKPNIFTALRESLGLKLESQKQQVEIVVIDSIERVPTEN